jgi:hypothetical protein
MEHSIGTITDFDPGDFKDVLDFHQLAKQLNEESLSKICQKESDFRPFLESHQPCSSPQVPCYSIALPIWQCP